MEGPESAEEEDFRGNTNGEYGRVEWKRGDRVDRRKSLYFW